MRLPLLRASEEQSSAGPMAQCAGDRTRAAARWASAAPPLPQAEGVRHPVDPGADATYSLGTTSPAWRILARDPARARRGPSEAASALLPATPAAALLPRTAGGNCRRPCCTMLAARGELFHGRNQRQPQKRPPRHHYIPRTFCLTAVLHVRFSAPFRRTSRHAAEHSDLPGCFGFHRGQCNELLGDKAGTAAGGASWRPPPQAARVAREADLHVGSIQKRRTSPGLKRSRASTGWRLALAVPSLRRGEILPASNPARRGSASASSGMFLRRSVALYARATLFAFPSLDEGFGMQVLEAMAAGSLIESNRSALPEWRETPPSCGSLDRNNLEMR